MQDKQSGMGGNFEDILAKLKEAYPNLNLEVEKKESDSTIIFQIQYFGKELVVDKKMILDAFPVVPFKDENNQYLFVFKQKKSTTENSSQLEGNPMAELFLAGPVYRILLSQELKPQKVILKKFDSEVEIEITPLSNQSLLEIPINLLMKGNSVIIINFNKNLKTDSAEKILKELNKEEAIKNEI
jgi:hypothetical protein